MRTWEQYVNAYGRDLNGERESVDLAYGQLHSWELKIEDLIVSGSGDR